MDATTIYDKNLQNLSHWNQKSNDFETWHATLGPEVYKAYIIKFYRFCN